MTGDKPVDYVVAGLIVGALILIPSGSIWLTFWGAATGGSIGLSIYGWVGKK